MRHGGSLLQGEYQMSHVLRAIRRHLWLLPALVMSLSFALPAAAAEHTAEMGHTKYDVSHISGSTLDEIKRLMADKDLTELRTTYNGKYGASMLFYADKLTYYVVLFHNKDFWRVIKTDQVGQAENVYGTFAEQSRKLAQVDIDTIRLEAGKKYTEHLLAINNERLQSLHADLQRQHSQAQQIAQAQQHSKQEAVELTQTLQSTSSQLEDLRQRIEALKSRQADLHMQLPSAAQAQAPASSSSTTAAPTPDGT